MVAVPIASIDPQSLMPPTASRGAPPIQTTEAAAAEDGVAQRKLAPTLVTIKPAKKGQPVKTLHLRPNYSYREGNWEIGRAAERANVKVREYQRGDRFLAWRKTVARKAKNIERRGLMRRGQKPKVQKVKKIRSRI